jgi:hypothetical protein
MPIWEPESGAPTLPNQSSHQDGISPNSALARGQRGLEAPLASPPRLTTTIMSMIGRKAPMVGLRTLRPNVGRAR